ncbi:MAG: hypothetical protein JW395_1232 [Nitrospira sp.]|nr:hypothetical protein [Nitrospira sp.]
MRCSAGGSHLGLKALHFDAKNQLTLRKDAVKERQNRPAFIRGNAQIPKANPDIRTHSGQTHQSRKRRVYVG